MTFSQNDKVKIKASLQEISNSLTRIEGERDNIKEIINTVSEEYQINKKIIRKLAKIYHKRNILEERADQNELNDTYDSVIGVPSNSP